MNIVAIVGRPNVGKSTLFNRLIGEQHAIVESEPGVTRDRLYGEADWNGKQFMIIDTGGFIPGSEDTMERAIREQAEIAIEEADVIVFLCDGRDGVTKFDDEIASQLRRSGKPIALVVNKCDNAIQDAYSFEFFKLGLGDPFPISSISGRNTGEFLDFVAEKLPESPLEDEDPRLKIAIVGRPNVGKSSLTNSLLGKDRMIVTDIPGTTRDAIDSTVKYFGEEIVLIDTAGLRRRANVRENIEMYSQLRTSRAIDRCDVAVVLLDAERGLESQDKKILNQVDENRRGIIIAVNKWDLAEKDSKTADKLTKHIYEELPMYDYVPVVFISALQKQRISKILDLAIEIKAKRETRIKTSELNEKILPFLERTPPPAVRGKDLRINYITQVAVNPPVFAFFCNFPQLVPDSYKRFVERTLRRNFDFSGTPVSFLFRKKNSRRGEQ